MSFFFHQTVATVVERDGFFLMVEEIVSNRVVINQPAGHLEPGESLLEAAVRETLEETAWHVQVQEFIGLYQYTPDSGDKCFMRCCFSAVATRHEAWRELDEEIVRPIWLSYDELKKYHKMLRSPLVLQAVEDYLAGQRYPLSLIKSF